MEGNGTSQSQTVKHSELYSKLASQWSVKKQQLKKRSILLGWLRLVCFVLAIFVPFQFLTAPSIPFFGTLTGFLILFAALIKHALKVKKEMAFVSHLEELNKSELAALNDEWLEFPDGESFIQPGHDFSHDLDLFGKGSLFQFINRTATNGGQLNLVNRLNNPSTEPKEITNHQQAIAELAEKLSFRQQFYAFGKLIQEQQHALEQIKQLTKAPLSFVGMKEQILTILFPVLFVGSIVLAAFGNVPANVPIILFILGLTITGGYFRKVSKAHKQISSLGSVLSRYGDLIALIEKESFGTEQLTTLKSRLSCQNEKASLATKQLGKYINLLDQRLNMFVGPILNGAFLWDIILSIKIKGWLSSRSEQICDWIQALHELDAMNSFAGFCFNHPDGTLPAFSNKQTLEADDLGHPLIPDKERVNNRFEISGCRKIVIITGANMAGKSTFLRTVGVNLVLAGNGAKVCARQFTYKPMRLITSMRAIDSLHKHESYFFSELKRLKYIVDTVKRGEQVFFILDEILKGTNSHDKTTGSIALTDQLLSLGAKGIIATHDLELGNLARQYSGQIVNNCFEVTFKNTELLFDYKLKPGLTQSHNATYLMKKMGLIANSNSMP